MARSPEELAEAVATRSREVVAALAHLDDDELLAPSKLPHWSRLTIACHLRYGANAFRRMTEGGVTGIPIAYYPNGRDRERPATLEPAPNESPQDVVASLRTESEALRAAWASLSDDDWNLVVFEPEDNPDLGPQKVGSLPLLRATEVEVHGTDLGLGLSHWSEVFVEAALPFRLEWLNRRRTNHRSVDPHVQGSWLLDATDGPTYVVSVDGERVSSRPYTADAPVDATITGTSRDLLALLLGREAASPVQYGGDVALAEQFDRAFPGP